jgi:CRP-like cAMP-binding protein
VAPTVADELAAVELFAEVDADHLARLAQRTAVRRLPAGRVLFVEGDPSEHLVVVRSGRLRVLVSSDRGDELALAVLGAGEVLGELSVIDGMQRSATVEALEASVVLLLPAAEVRTVLLANPPALLAVARQLATQVRRVSGSAADLVFLDLPRRLAKLLVTQAGDRSVVELGMSQSGLAAQLGTTRQSVNRALSGLARRGWIAIDGSSVTVRDAAALRRFSGSP